MADTIQLVNQTRALSLILLFAQALLMFSLLLLFSWILDWIYLSFIIKLDQSSLKYCFFEDLCLTEVIVELLRLLAQVLELLLLLQ